MFRASIDLLMFRSLEDRLPPEYVILTKDPTLFKKAFNLMLESLNPEPASTNDLNTSALR